MFGGFFGGAGGDDGVGVKGGGSGIGGEERATDGEVDGGGVFRGEGGEDEVDFGGGILGSFVNSETGHSE